MKYKKGDILYNEELNEIVYLSVKTSLGYYQVESYGLIIPISRWDLETNYTKIGVL